MTRETETPLEAARLYALEQEAQVNEQKQLILQLAARGRSIVDAKRELAGMKHLLILLLDRLARLSEIGPDTSA